MRILFCTVILLCFAAVGFAAQPEDFAYKGLQLGDTYETMLEKLGNPRSDIDHYVDGRLVRYYIYRKDTRIGVDRTENKLVDLQIGDKDYTARDGVKLGATPYKILKVYGKTSKEKIAGRIYYIYHRDAQPEERLLLEVGQGYLGQIRITNLFLESPED